MRSALSWWQLLPVHNQAAGEVPMRLNDDFCLVRPMEEKQIAEVQGNLQVAVEVPSRTAAAQVPCRWLHQLHAGLCRDFALQPQMPCELPRLRESCHQGQELRGDTAGWHRGRESWDEKVEPSAVRNQSPDNVHRRTRNDVDGVSSSEEVVVRPAVQSEAELRQSFVQKVVPPGCESRQRWTRRELRGLWVALHVWQAQRLHASVPEELLSSECLQAVSGAGEGEMLLRTDGSLLSMLRCQQTRLGWRWHQRLEAQIHVVWLKVHQKCEFLNIFNKKFYLNSNLLPVSVRPPVLVELSFRLVPGSREVREESQTFLQVQDAKGWSHMRQDSSWKADCNSLWRQLRQ